MSRSLRPATRDWDGKAVEHAVKCLRAARDALKDAECPKALAKVRLALRSAEGAQRHVDRRIFRTTKSAPLQPHDQSNKVPNLDAMTREDLRAFYKKHNGGRNSRDLYPFGGRGTRKATFDLAAYAGNKAIAMGFRHDGDINAAKHHEDLCDRIYKRLPAFARW